MTNETTSAPNRTAAWFNTPTYVTGIICLLIGVTVGYLVRGSAGPVGPTTAKAAVPTANAPAAAAAPAEQRVTPEQLKHMADAQVAPLTERLKKEPKNAKLLADIGNSYLDAQQFPVAIDYYQRSLKLEPQNTNVRTNLGSALWFIGDADGSIEQFKIVLKAEPTKPNALMNLGVVEWQGKMDVKAAVAAWEKLLKTNPNFSGRANVEQLIAQAKKHSNIAK